MNHYAAEQLSRQRHDQFAQEVRGDHLMRAASDANTFAKAIVVRSPKWDISGMIKTIRRRAFAVLLNVLSGI